MTYTTTYVQASAQASAQGDSWSLLPHPARFESTEYANLEFHPVTIIERSEQLTQTFF